MEKKYFTEEERKEADRKRHKEWVRNNPEKVTKSWKKYRKENKDEMNARRRKDRKDNPNKYAEYILEYRESNVRRFLGKKFAGTKSTFRRKKRQKKDIQIDLDFLVSLYEQQDGKCAISQHPMTIKFKCPYSVSIDRIDSSQGYIPGNVQLLCQTMNLAKNSFKNEDIIEFWNNRFINQELDQNHLS